MKNFDMEWKENGKVNMAFVSADSAEEAIARIKANRPAAFYITAQERKPVAKATSFDVEWKENGKVNMAYVEAASAEEAIADIRRTNPKARNIEAQERK